MEFRVVENPEPEFNIDEIIQDYQNTDLTVQEIKEKHNISKSQWEHAIIREMKEQGVPMRQSIKFNVIENSQPSYDINEVIHDYTMTDLTVQEIKQKHGIGRSQWINLIKKFKRQGIPIRGRGRFVKPKNRRRVKVNDKTF